MAFNYCFYFSHSFCFSYCFFLNKESKMKKIQLLFIFKKETTKRQNNSNSEKGYMTKYLMI